MAFCTRCGVVMHDDDVNDHVCADVPKKGEEIRPAAAPTKVELRS
jgi:hypothetical protein